MPVKKSELYLSKLLLGVIAVMLGAAVQACAALLAGHTELLAQLPVTVLAALAYLAVSLPLLFRLGLEKGRILFLMLTVALVALRGAIIGAFSWKAPPAGGAFHYPLCRDSPRRQEKGAPKGRSFLMQREELTACRTCR